MYTTRATLLVCVLLAACSRAPSNASGASASAAAAGATAAAPASDRLARIFTPDMLGANLGYLESIAGPAFKTEGAVNTYKVDGCTVLVGASGGKVVNLGIDGYGGRCRFDIAQYFAGGYEHPAPSEPTFGDIGVGLGGYYSADCYRDCGNAAAPVVSLSYSGSHADNFNQLVASTPVIAAPVVNAYGAWSDALVAKYGEAAAANGKLPDTLNDVAAKALGPLRPTTIRVGQDLIPGQG
jgi:hypothetical protein